MLSTPEINKRIADIEGKVFTRFNDQVKNPHYEDYVWVECKHWCMTDGEYDSEDIFRPYKYDLMSKHGIARMLIPVFGWVYRATEGNTTVMLVEEHGEYKAICLAVLAKFNKLN